MNSTQFFRSTLALLSLFSGPSFGVTPQTIEKFRKENYRYVTKGTYRSEADPNEWYLFGPAQSVEGANHPLFNLSGSPEAAVLVSKISGAKVLVGVIDTGVEITHSALKDQIAVNELEKNGTVGVDDDHNGFVDDIYGWNFLVDSKNQTVIFSSLEAARKISKLEQISRSRKLSAAELSTLSSLKAKLDVERDDWKVREMIAKMDRDLYARSLKVLLDNGLKGETLSLVLSLNVPPNFTGDPKVLLTAKSYVTGVLRREQNLQSLSMEVAKIGSIINTWFDTSADPRTLDHASTPFFANMAHGNSDVIGESTFDHNTHGTHVSGVIARYSPATQIIPVRAIPEGDEFDIDIAASIKYLVDRGARVINMSFGKYQSLNPNLYRTAFEYAAKKDVLLVLAAGNDSLNNDVTSKFPSTKIETREFSNVIQVGASYKEANQMLVGNFSNFGKLSVGIFAPGVEIYAPISRNKFASLEGTSMAAPQVSGLAALLLALNPKLTAKELKDLIYRSARLHPNLLIIAPGKTDKDQLVPFKDLAITPGIIDTARAIEQL